MDQGRKIVLKSALAVTIPLAWIVAAVGQSARPNGSVPDLSGFWERKDEVGSGSFGGTLEGIPRAALKPEIIAANREAAARQARGEVVSLGSKWCLTNQYPFFMQPTMRSSRSQRFTLFHAISIWTVGRTPTRRTFSRR